MAGSRGNERKCPRRLNKDTALCLSDLPDEILLLILSFLPTKSLVATSLLSRRWEYLWTSTPNLQLHESLFSGRRSEFMNFAERALILRGGSSLVSFSLQCGVRNDESRINTWISSAIRCNVEQLSLSLGLDHEGTSLFLPFCMFGCQSLVKLNLGMSSTIRVPSMICLPRLKHLKLTQVEFADNESTENLLSHPLLEELILCNCVWNNVTAVNVNSPMLQSLAIEDDDEDDDEDDLSEERQVCFFGDNLKFFRYMGHLPPTQYCICGSTSQLSEAKISVDIPDHEVQDMDGPSNRYCKLLNSLSMVQNLTLTDAAVHSFYLLSQCLWLQTTLPVFERVTRLKITECSYPKTISVSSMICLPQLKHLAVEYVKFEDIESTEKLLSHPLLEELIISDCIWGEVTAVNVNSPMLQSLAIQDFDEEDWSEERQVCFFGGNLKFFRYKGYLPTQYCICGSTLKLSEAEISVYNLSHEFQDMYGPSNRYYKLVNSLSMVQNLTLSDAALHSLYLLSQCPWLRTSFLVFERVSRLNLISAYYDQSTMRIDYVLLRKICKRCPYLEHLNFMKAVVFNSSTGELPLLRPMPSCFRTHLKKITLQRYDPKCKEQAEAIHVLLYSAPVLEEMVLHCKRDVRISGEDSMVAELEREFNTCAKVSENFRISVVLV